MMKVSTLTLIVVVASISFGILVLGGTGVGLYLLTSSPANTTVPPPLGTSLNPQRQAVGGLRLVDPSWHGYAEFNEEKWGLAAGTGLLKKVAYDNNLNPTWEQDYYITGRYWIVNGERIDERFAFTYVYSVQTVCVSYVGEDASIQQQLAGLPYLSSGQNTMGQHAATNALTIQLADSILNQLGLQLGQ